MNTRILSIAARRRFAICIRTLPLIVATLIGILTLLPTEANAQTTDKWTRTNGPLGGYVRAFLKVNTTLYAGVYGGVYASTDNGTSWTEKSTGLPSAAARSVFSLTAVGDTLYAGTQLTSNSGGGIYKSTNGGANWQLASNGLPGASLQDGSPYGPVDEIRSLGGALFAAMNNSSGANGVYRSLDGGQSWQNLAIGSNGLPAGTFPRGLAVKDNAILTQNQGSYRTYRSTDGGSTWVQGGTLSTGSPVISFTVGADSIFASMAGEGLYYTLNGGETWTKLSSITGVSIFSVAVTPAGLVAATNKGFYRSADKGLTWAAINTGVPVFANGVVPAFLTVDLVDGKLFAGSNINGGVFVSTNNGDSWAASNTGLTASFTFRFAQKGDLNFVSTNGDGVYRTSTNGQVWQQVSTNLTSAVLPLSFTDNGILYAGTRSGVFKSADNGDSWTATSNIPSTGTTPGFCYSLLTLPGMDTRVFAGLAYAGPNSPYGLFETFTGGQVWRSAGLPLPTTIVALTQKDQSIYAATTDFGIYRSTNLGVTWAAANKGIAGSASASVIAGRNDNRIYAAFFRTVISSQGDVSPGGVYRSTDGGQNWTAINAGLPADVSAQSLVEISTGNLLLATTTGVYRTTNAGDTWTVFNTGFETSGLAVNAFSVINTGDGSVTMLAATGEAVWQRAITGLVVTQPFSSNNATASEMALPTSFKLGVAYPNPFNPSTNISYQLPQSETVSLKVYDMTGKEVATLVNSQKAAGQYTVSFDGSKFASGLYLYRLQAGSFVATQKMLLVK